LTNRLNAAARLFGAEEDLQAYVGDPAWLVVGGGDGLEAAATHQEQVEGFGLVEGLAATEAKRGFALLGFAGGELPRALAGWDAVGVLGVVELEVGFGGVGELVADEEASAPALRDGVVAEVVADFAVEADGADAGVDLKREKETGAGSDEAAGDGACGIVEEKLWIGGDAEVDELFGAVGCAGGVA